NGKATFLREVSPYSVVGNTTLQPNTWYHVAGVYNGSTMSLYLNGVSDATPVSLGSVASSTSDVYLGGRNSGTSFFTGFMDEVKIYNYARSAAQIQADYAAGAAALGGSSNSHASLSSGLV